MTCRLSKSEWEEKIASIHRENINGAIVDLERKLWWVSPKSEGMRLTKIGLIRFQQAGFTFHKYECVMAILSGSVLLGLNKMQCPYYLTDKKEKPPPEYDFYIADEEYAMMLTFLEKDLASFAKGFK